MTGEDIAAAGRLADALWNEIPELGTNDTISLAAELVFQILAVLRLVAAS